MKKIFTMCCAAAAMLAGIVSCEEPETGYEGINYIYLEANSNYMYDVENVPFELTARLTTTLDQDLSLTFKVLDDANNVIAFANNPINIPAGELTGTVEITAGTLPAETESVIVHITIDESAGIPEKVQVSGNFSLTVRSSAMTDLTEEQLAIVMAYNSATGIDLAKYIGLVNVTTVYTAPTEDGYPMQDETITGTTEITLSDQSTAEQPVLKMTYNPMGIQTKMLNKLKSSTYDNQEWDSDYNFECFKVLKQQVPWTDSETFSMSLDGIKLQSDGNVEFVADKSYFDEDYEENVKLFIVPFEYSFSLYEKEQQALADGKIGAEATSEQYWDETATYSPSFYLNCEDTTEETANEEFEPANWVASSASISNEKLEFTFCMYNYVDYGYTKVVATYTPNE